MRRWAALAALGLLIALGAAPAWWALDLRWRPKTLDASGTEVARLLDQAGWVSPGLSGPALYMVSFRTCPDCIRFEREQFPDLHAAGVDTRVIEIARRDVNGIPRSTPAERATVAELWLRRSWSLLEAWRKTPPQAWTAPGVAPADGDPARTAAVEQGRELVDRLRPLLKADGVEFAYPLLVWRAPDGRLRACACEKRATYRFVRRELGVR